MEKFKLLVVILIVVVLIVWVFISLVQWTGVKAQPLDWGTGIGIFALVACLFLAALSPYVESFFDYIGR